jgi:hypothetical protein
MPLISPDSYEDRITEDSVVYHTQYHGPAVTSLNKSEHKEGIITKGRIIIAARFSIVYLVFMFFSKGLSKVYVI